MRTTVLRAKLNCTFLDTQCATRERQWSPPPNNRTYNISCNERRPPVIPENLYLREGCPSTAPIANMSRYASEYHLNTCWDPEKPGDIDSNRDHIDRVIFEDTQSAKIVSSKLTSMGGVWIEDLESFMTYCRLFDCPVFLSYGEESLGDCSASKTSLALCDPYLEIQDADVILSLPDLAIRNVTTTGSPREILHVYGMSRWLGMWSTKNQDELYRIRAAVRSKCK